MAALEPKNSPSTLASEPGKQSKVESGPESHPQNLPKKIYLAFLPLWVSGPLRSPKAWKVMLRCWIAVFASFVLSLPDASLRTVGTTSFFAILTSLFLPPYLPVQLTIFLLSTLMLGLLSAVDALSAIGAEIARVNRTRWRRRTDSGEGELDKAAAALGAAIEDFKTVRRMELLQPFAALLDIHAAAAANENETNENRERELLPLRSLFIAYVFVSNMLSIAEAVQVLLGAVQDINAKRTRGARLWAPTGLRNVWRLLTVKGDNGDGAAAFGEDTSAGVGVIGEEGEKDYRKDPDSRPPTNALQKFMNGIHRGYLWTKTAEAVFTFKYIFTSVALWLPSVFRSSAHFYYVEKGIWALIMAQTTLSVFSLISQSLRTGEPMHQVIPTNLLDRLFYHETHGRASGANTLPPVDVGAIKSLSYMYYATSIVAVYQLLRALDELHRITKDLCGEIPLTGFSEWREEYDRAGLASLKYGFELKALHIYLLTLYYRPL